MSREEYCAVLSEVLAAYPFSGKMISCERYGSGHINDNFRVEFESAGGAQRFIVQRINHDIFKRPDELMENIYRVTGFLADRIRARGGNPFRETMTIVKTSDDKLWYAASNGTFWRAYIFIDGAISYDAARSPKYFYNALYAFGNFQRTLADFPVDTLHETIPHFHDTPHRYAEFEAAVAADVCGRAATAADEIAYYRSKKDTMAVCMDALREGKIPLRVTHNDTKLNNVLIDAETGRGICIVDLDTVMPGLAVFDFGDAIRFGASTAAEDETDLSKVSLSLELFEAACSGFLDGCAGTLTPAEISLLTASSQIIMLENGMRFLTDYLQGDAYYMTRRPGHNLDRTRTQIVLSREVDAKRAELEKIVARVSGMPKP